MELVEEIKKAVEFTKSGKVKDAEKIYLALLKDYPENSSILSFLGLLYYNLGKLKKAEKYLEKSYNISNSKVISQYLGEIKYAFTKYESAKKFLEEAIETNNSIDIYKMLINSYMHREEYHKAYEHVIKAQKLYPFDEDLLGKLASCAFSIGKFDESENYNRKLLFMNPKSSIGWYNKGLFEEVINRDNEAARYCFKMMGKYGNKLSAYLNIAISYGKHKDTRKKSYYYIKKIQKINPELRGLKFIVATYYLKQKMFNKGYKYYVQHEYFDQDRIDYYKKFKTEWKGGKFKNETLLVYGDQGLGDQIQFSRYIPFLAKKFKKLKILVRKPLLDLFKRSFKSCKNAEFYPIESNFPKFDKSVHLASSLYFLKMNYNNIPLTEGYLIVNDKKVKEFKDKYFNIDKKKVGICWEAGGAGIRDHIHRTLNVEYFENIINNDSYEVYSLQKNPTLENYKKYKELIDISKDFEDFDDTSAAVKNLDILITVDTSVAHVAGALGVKTFLILPYDSDWRWFDNTETTEWYDSVRIFKQESVLDWQEVFDRIELELLNVFK